MGICLGFMGLCGIEALGFMGLCGMGHCRSGSGIGLWVWVDGFYVTT